MTTSEALDKLELEALRKVAREAENVVRYFGDDYRAIIDSLSGCLNVLDVIQAQQQGDPNPPSAEWLSRTGNVVPNRFIEDPAAVKCQCIDGMRFAVEVCPSDSKIFRGGWTCQVHGEIKFGRPEDIPLLFHGRINSRVR